MTPTEHELTVATEALARHVHGLTVEHVNSLLPASVQRRGWDDLTAIERHPLLEGALTYVAPILEALPDRLTTIRTADANDSAPYDDTIDAVETTLKTYPA